jgi:predicted secreted Zn-dependent protease
VRIVGISALTMLLAASVSANAGVRATATTSTYKISGGSGQELIQEMDRKGPRQGYQAKAIAQTSYDVKWNLGWQVKGGVCTPSQANAIVRIKYRYPQLVGTSSPNLKNRWARFLAGVRKHEEQHGRIAIQMVSAAQKSIARIRSAGDPNCVRAKQEASRIMLVTSDQYEAYQRQFDAVEHQPGGNVERLVGRLLP